MEISACCLNVGQQFAMIFRFKGELTSQAIRNRQGQHLKTRTKVSLEKRPPLTSVDCTIRSNVSCNEEETSFHAVLLRLKGTLGGMQLLETRYSAICLLVIC